MKKSKTTHIMSSVYMIIFVALFLIVTGRFMYIQTTGEVSGISLNDWAEQQRTASYTMNSERGQIYDKNGMVLAYDRPTYRMYAILDEVYSENAEEPLHVSNAEETAEQLAPLLDVDEEEIRTPLENGLENGRFQVEFGKIGNQISKEVKDEIEELDIPGINFEEEPMRYYPNGMFASHIIGFAREEDEETDEGVEHTINGVTGMENVMNDILGGEDGYISYQRDIYNDKLLDPNEIIQPPEDGDDVYLTIDQKIQTLLEDLMTQADEQYNPEKMNAIIMNPKTGEIVAMSSRPSYDPNNPTDVENWYNDPISTPFEPGSTFKIFTWAAAMDAGVYNGSEGFESGTYQPNEKIDVIGDHNNREGWGTISYDEGFERSSNVAASKLVWEKLGADQYYEYLQAFGFEEPTGIDLPGEAVGKISYNWPSDKLRTAFGQSSTVTPIQQMKAATAIVNGGKMVKPYVVDKVVDSTTGDIIEQSDPEVVGQPISEEAAEEMKELLSSVVNGEHGTGKAYQLEDYMVGGKTGTAQIPNPDGGGYLQGRGESTYAFLGMAPIDDPQLMVYVSIQQPELEIDESGSDPLSFIFNNVVENSLHYMKIDPENNEAPNITELEMPEVIGESTSEVREQMTDEGFNTVVIGEGATIVDSSIHSGSSVLPNEKVILVTDEPTMPDITDWSLREVMTFANLLELKVESFGSGYVTTQNIEVGNPLQEGDYLGIELEIPHSDDEEQISDEEEETEEETESEGSTE